MTEHPRPYPHYKDSGIPWIGQIPSDWGVRRGKWLFRHRKELNTNRANKNVLSLTLRGVVNNDPDDPEGLVPKDYATYQLFRKDDLVFKLIDLENLRTSRVGLLHEDGIMSSAYVRLIAQNAEHIRFFFHQYFDLYQRGIYNQLGAGVRSTLGPNDVLNLSILIPSTDEQAAIVRFLDHANRRIERYIRAKRKLIAILNEQKQVIIHRAVTRGIDPNVRLKPSGIPWLGDIPEHWEVLTLGRVSTARCDGPFGSGLKSTHYTSKGVRVIRLQNIGPAEFRDRDAAFISQKHYATLGDHNVMAGDLLVAGLGDDRIPAGRACVAPFGIEPAMVKADCFRFRLLQHRIIPQYAALHLSATASAATACLSTGATRQRINLQTTARRAIALPTIPEQEELIMYVLGDTTSLASTIARAEREIALIREYRTRLVADVVTGQLDVRAAAAKLPDKPEALEPFDEAEHVEELNGHGRDTDTEVDEVGDSVRIG